MSRDPDHDRRRGELIAAHGVARHLGREETAAAHLRLLADGVTGVSALRDVVAFAYRDQAAADAYAASNREHNGIPTLGTYSAGGEVIGVLDLRPATGATGS